MTHSTAPPIIQIVEDDPATSELLVDLLTMYGYPTRVAGTGHQALAQLAAQPAQLVLLDRRLPDMDGLNVCRAIRETVDSTVPIILLTADRSSDLDAAAQEAGITNFLTKPFDPEQLLQCVAEVAEKAARYR